jgi:hypothetical protein
MQPPLPAESLAYYRDEQSSLRAIVRMARCAAIAHAGLLLVGVLTQLGMFSVTRGLGGLFMDRSTTFAIAAFMLVAVASVGVIAAAIQHLRGALGAHRWLLITLLALVAAQLAREAVNVSVAIAQIGDMRRSYSLKAAISYIGYELAGAIMPLVLPLLLIALLRRPEIRRLF